MKVELYLLKKTNSEISKELLKSRSLESCVEATNDNLNNKSGGKLDGNTATNLQISVNISFDFRHPPVLPQNLSPPDESEVINTRELIITNFIDG